MNDRILDSLAHVAEQCEELGELEAADLLDQALALLDPQGAVQNSTPVATASSLQESYQEQVETARTQDERRAAVEAIVRQVKRSIETAVHDLDALAAGLETSENVLADAATAQAIALIIDSYVGVNHG